MDSFNDYLLQKVELKMRTSSQIKDTIHDLRSDLDSMIALSEQQDRDFTSLEAAKADQILAQLETEKAALDTTTKLEAERNARSMQNPLMQEMLAANGHGSSSAQWTRDSRGRGYAILSKADKASSIFKPQAANEFGHFVVAKIFGASRSTPSSVRAALTTSDNSLGGFLVPSQLSGDIVDLARAKSVLMQAGTRTAIMDSDSLTIPKLETDATITTKSENAAFTPTSMVFGARQLNTRTAGCLVELSRELAEDAPDLLAEQLQMFLASAMAAQIDSWGLSGTGSAQPLGILTRSEIHETGSIGAIDWADPAAAAALVRAANHEPNAAIMNTEIYSDLLNSAAGDGVNSSRGWLGAPPTLANVQMLSTTSCPVAKMIIGDFTRYLVGIRSGALVEASTVAGDAFAKHQVHVKITSRFDFVTLDDSAFEILAGITS